jgi:hypothetical protein
VVHLQHQPRRLLPAVAEQLPHTRVT